MKYIKKFESESDYQAYLVDKDYAKPNVSWTTDTNAVHYDKKPSPPETRIVATFKNDNDYAVGVNIVGNLSGAYVIDPIEAIEHDGVQIDMNKFDGTTTIKPNEQETFKYTLKDNTVIAANQFSTCNYMTSVTIPSSITSIGAGAFDACSLLESITCEATTPPTLGRHVFSGTNDCPIYVPQSVVLVYKANAMWSGFSSRIFPIPGSIADTVSNR